MNSKHRSIALLLTMLLLLCVSFAALGEEATQELQVTNTPIKGKILLEKQGLVLTGFEETEDVSGYTIHSPIFATGHPKGAVFEVRAAEEIIGKDGTLWFSVNDLAAEIVTSGNGADESPLLPLGRYYVTETAAPTGYICDNTRYEVVLAAKDSQTAVVEVKLLAGNEYLPIEASLVKEKEVMTVAETEGDLVQTTLTTVPGEGFVFGLYNAEAIPYADTELPANSLMAVGTTNTEGKLSISGMYPHGNYYFKELSAPEGWKVTDEHFLISITPEYVGKDNLIHAALDEPIVNRLIQTPISISKTDLTGTESLPGALIEVKNSDGEIVLRAYTDAEGKTPTFPAVPGEYTFKEVISPEEYELCTTEITFSVDADGQIEGQTTVADDYNRFSILKVDENHAPLAGVEFGLYTEEETLICTAISDENGMVTFEKIPYGSYFIQELAPLTGYVRDYTRIPVTIDGSYINPTEPLATVNNCPTEILLSKVDQDGAALAGAKFGLYKADGSLLMTAVSDADGLIRFTHVPQGSYMIHEITAPDGYLLSTKIVKLTIDDGYINPTKPVATLVNHLKRIQCIKEDTSGRPLQGVEFSLINARTGKVVETVTSDQNGVFTFTQFGFGTWIIRETAAPEGYCRMEDKQFMVGYDWQEPEPIRCVNVPNHYEFIKTDASGAPMEGVKFQLEDDTGNVLGTFISGKDGIVQMTSLTPGSYIIRETETLEGFSLSGEVKRFTLDEHYTVPDQLPRWVNYTIIQTGVNIAVTTVMWLGIGFIVLSGVVTILRKRRKHGQPTK